MPTLRTIPLAAALLIATADLASTADTSIAYLRRPYAELLPTAQREGRPVMIYFHFDGCGACRTMERTALRNDSVVRFLNERFVNYEVNTLKGEGIATAAAHQVRPQPAFLFLDPQGTELHRIVGVFTPGEFLAQARTALDPAHNLAMAKERYRAGDRDPAFLLDLCYRLRDAAQLDSTVVQDYLATQALDRPDDERNIRFIQEFVVHNFKVMMPYGSRAFDFLYTHREAFYAVHGREQVDVRILWVLDHALMQATLDQDEARFYRVLAMMECVARPGPLYFKERDGRTTGARNDTYLLARAQLAYHERSGDRAAYGSALQAYIQAIWNDAGALNEIAWRYYEERTDPAELEQALGWSARSVELDDNYANNDTYAALLHSTGKHQQALERARHAVALAGASGEDHTATDALITRIEAALRR